MSLRAGRVPDMRTLENWRIVQEFQVKVKRQSGSPERLTFVPDATVLGGWHARRSTLDALHELTLTQTSVSRDGALLSHPRFFISILSLGTAKDKPITDTDVQSDGRPLSLPGDSHGALPLLRDAVAAARPTCRLWTASARQQWIDNNMSYLDALVLALLQDKDSDFMKDSWPKYHYKHMCRLGVCPQYFWTIDVYGLSTPTTTIIHSCLQKTKKGIGEGTLAPRGTRTAGRLNG
eukprot:scaffold18575_cov104-Isochrysis_galbana.AAC.5